MTGVNHFLRALSFLLASSRWRRRRRGEETGRDVTFFSLLPFTRSPFSHFSLMEVHFDGGGVVVVVVVVVVVPQTKLMRI